MGWDLAPHFKDCCGNDYVGLDMVDIENLAGVLWRLDELITHPMIYGELIENLPAAELHDLMKGAGGEPHLRRPSPQTNVLSQTCQAIVAQSCRSVIKLRCRQHHCAAASPNIFADRLGSTQTPRRMSVFVLVRKA